jgi:hypothetical protein
VLIGSPNHYTRAARRQATAYIGADTSLDSASDPATNIVLLPQDGEGEAAGAAGAAPPAAPAAAAAALTTAGKGKGGGSGESPVLPVIPFEACLTKFAAAEVIWGGAGGGVCVCVCRLLRFVSACTAQGTH